MFFIMLSCTACAQYNYTQKDFNAINFEGGGFCTSLVCSSDGKILYLRTDIGGVYKQSDGKNWKFISQFALTPAALMVQGLSVNPYNADELIIACGDHLNPTDSERGLWKTTDGGITWKHVLGDNTGTPEINFGGNQFDLKIGGQCIYFHPSIKGKVYSGGLRTSPNGKNPGIFISDKSGEENSFSLSVSSKNIIIGDITSIKSSSIKPNEIWVGTNMGLYKSDDFGNNWSGPLFKNYIKKVYNIAIYDSSTIFIAGGNLFRINTTKEEISDLTKSFGGDSAKKNEIVSLLLGEHSILASRMGKPTKYSTDAGETWSEDMLLTLQKEFNPKHSLDSEDKIYWSKLFAERNPVNKNILYITGGSGTYISENSGKTWRYNNSGLNLTVVYKTIFTHNGYIYMPLSDWGMARTRDSLKPEVLDYSRTSTLSPPPPQNDGDTYIPNITRCLVSPNNINHTYIIGGSVYSYYPAMSESFDYGNKGTYRIMSSPGLPLYPFISEKSDATIIDGAITSMDGKNDNLILLMGGGSQKKRIIDNPDIYGAYYSTNNGINFYKSSFPGKSELKYKLSIVEDLFTTTNNLATDRFDSSIVYLYLEGGNEIYKGKKIQAGGFFKSNDAGKTFQFLSSVVQSPDDEYRNPSWLSLNRAKENYFLLAMKNKGLFLSENKGENWKLMKGWNSAIACDCEGDVILCFGKRDNEKYNFIYLSKDNGANWKKIYIEGMGSIPSVRAIDINPYKNEVWLSTSGQGVVVFRF